MPSEVRIIGGEWKRTKLAVPDRPGLRPTPSRVRETLFNWLGPDLRGCACLDAFSGTGALGLEAASRGASSVVLVEQDPALARGLQAVISRLRADERVRVVTGDFLRVLPRLNPGQFDLIFLDPPFESELLASGLAAAATALRAGGRVYLEAPGAWTEADCAATGWELMRNLKAGAVHAHLLKRA